MSEQGSKIFNYARGSELMAEQGMDMILANTKRNIGYIADYYYYEGLPEFMMEDGQSFYEAFVGVPRDPGKGAFIVGCTGEDGYLAEVDPWIKDRRLWGPQFVVTGGKQQTNLKSSPVEAVVEALTEKGLASARIGVEMCNIKHIHYEQLRANLPQATFCDADPLLWQMRMVKTQEEIERLRIACRAIDKAAETGFKSARPGMTELEMERIIYKTLAEEGCTPVGFLIGFGPKGARLCAPTENRLTKGQIMRFDISAEYQGYIGDLSRVAAFGKVSPKAEWAHRVILSANQAMRKAAKPGMTGAELRRLEMEIFQSEGLIPLIPIAGHGVGRTVHEHPFLTEDDATVLTPGMALALEPTIRLVGVGSVNIEDTVVVTEEGVESLTNSSRGLYDYA
jgi:Xaa-Pro dipeptidase